MKCGKSLIAAAAALTLMTLLQVPQVEAAQRVILVRPHYRFYGPATYFPYYYPAWRQPVYVTVPRTGDVKIKTHLKDAAIFIDGGYAGTTGKLKEFYLQPGNHDIQVRDSGGNTLFQNRVQVLAGKTLEIKL